MAEEVFIAIHDGCIGYIGAGSNSYATVHDIASGNYLYNAINYPVAENAPYQSTYYIYRGGLVFDTSSFSASVTITGAKISLYGHDKSGTGHSLTVVSGEDLADNFVLADYGDLLGATVSFGSIAVEDYVLEAWNDIILSQSGIDSIVKEGTTRFGLRISDDISNATPAAKQGFTWKGVARPIGFRAKLTITFTPVAPTVTTQAVTDITATTATGNGNINSLGYPSPTQHGHCWNTTGAPTVADSKTQNGVPSATGTFTSALTNLTEGLTYYVRAYATNIAGTVYGTEVMFISGSVYHVLFEYYRTNDDAAVQVTGVADYLQGQTFTPLITHDIWIVGIKVYRVGDPGTITVAIKATSGGLPTGDDLVSGTFPASFCTTDTAGTWILIIFNSAYTLTASTVYSIVVKSSVSDGSNKLYWRQDATSATYTGGSTVLKVVNWNTDSGKDFMFEEQGLPVSPDTEEEDQSGWTDVGW